MQFLLLFFFLMAKQPHLAYAESCREIPQEHSKMIQQKPYRVLGIGSACMDFSVDVSEEFLFQVSGQKGGAEPIDIEQFDQILLASGQQPFLATGGSCANTIKGLAGLKETCGFFSHVGKDPLGKRFVKCLQNLGITGLYYNSPRPTARVLCLITPDCQRTMRFFGGCSEERSSKFLHSDYFNGIELLHIDAYTLRNGDLLEKSMQLAKAAGAKISLDLSSFEIVRQYRKTLLILIPKYVDIVFANADEIRALTHVKAREGCEKLSQLCDVSVTLLGSEGCLVAQRGEIFHSPAFPANIIDSTGSGDLFASGFLYGYLQGYSLKKCAEFGNRLGSAITEVQGAELSSKKLMEIQNALLNPKPD